MLVERGREREFSHSILCRSLNLTCAQVRFHSRLSDQSNQLFHRLYKISDITFLFFSSSLRRDLSFIGGFVFFLSTYHITVLSRTKFYPTP
ncbi:hypothetical protein Peur_054487 [Populus x canadensis]